MEKEYELKAWKRFCLDDYEIMSTDEVKQLIIDGRIYMPFLNLRKCFPVKLVEETEDVCIEYVSVYNSYFTDTTKCYKLASNEFYVKVSENIEFTLKLNK